MRYPIDTPVIVDVTKAPYFADSTGKTDCTAALKKALDDILVRENAARKDTIRKLYEISENGKYDTHIGFEAAHMVNGHAMVTFEEFLPDSRILFFPKGTYLISDTITYTLDDLKNPLYLCPQDEADRNIHFLGESEAETVIKLCDNAEGFGKGSKKPMIAFYRYDVGDNDIETSNTAFANSAADLTLDAGKGNPGAVGIRYHSSNCGRLENITIKGESGYAGVQTVFGSQAVFDNITVSGFDYGFDIVHSAMLALDEIDVSGCKKAGVITHSSIVCVDHIKLGDLPLFAFMPQTGEGHTGRYHVADKRIKAEGDEHNLVFYDADAHAASLRKMPKYRMSENAKDFAFVDDYGAVGDGVTDCTIAIRKAMESGKPVVLFGSGRYYINGSVKIPATVECIDFLYCGLTAGPRLIGGEIASPFIIAEDAEKPLFVSHILTFEQFFGHCHLFNHASRRTAVFKDMMPFFAHLYKNSVGGGKVYFDNCFSTTGTYTRNSVIHREGFEPVYSHGIPYDFHGQVVYGRQVNLERADVAIRAVDSDILLDGYRTEGPGTAMEAHGSHIDVNLFNAGIGIKDAENALFEIDACEFDVCGVYAFGFSDGTQYNKLVRDGDTLITREDADGKKGFGVKLHHYNSKGRQ